MAVDVKIQKNQNGQFFLTIPKTIGEILNLKQSDVFEFKLNKNFDIFLKKVDKKTKSIHRKLQRTTNKQFIITIPKTLCEILLIGQEEKIKFELTKSFELHLKIIKK
jgi:bifunctional DNA-binding transcriptional regulator/antitoxin component of YhaV-PrlF toxin-antitoxin module